MADEAFYEFEVRADESIKRLPLLRMPIRAVMAGLHGVVDALVNGGMSGQPTRQAEGDALISRLSYLYPFLASCPVEPIGRDGKDALDAYCEADPAGVQSRELLSYTHLCQLIPEVRRGYYNVAVRTGGFDLRHKSLDFAQAEVRDILLSELSLAFMDVRPPALRESFDLLTGALKLRGRDRKSEPSAATLMPRVLASLYNHAFNHTIEAPLLTSDGFASASGITLEEFFRVRSALLAFAAFCSGMRASIRRRIQRDGESEGLVSEYIEWVNVFWIEDFFYQMTSQMSGIPRTRLEGVLEYYTFDIRPGFADPERIKGQVGEGFVPPLMRFPGAVLFSPDVLLRFITGRNIGYVLNRIDRERFDDTVSHHLEPQLISSAVELLQSIPGLEIVEDVPWGKGQIDLLVYIPSRDTALHVQAKGAIPPQGARMTRAIELRVEEAFKQLNRFRTLKPDEQDRILSNALKRPVSGVTIVDVVLLRSCAGTEKIWSMQGDTCILTLSVLSALARQAESEKSPDIIADCKNRAEEYIEDLIRAVNPKWETGSISIDGVEVTMPLLKFNEDVLVDRRMKAWQGRTIGKASGNAWKALQRDPNDPILAKAKERQVQEKQADEALVARVKGIIALHPEWGAKKIGKAVGLHSDWLVKHPIIGPLILDQTRKGAKKRKK